jgi:hypothetical protein
MRKIIITIIAALAIIGLAPGAAQAKATPCYVAPTHSATAAHCRAEGWILRDNLRIDPHSVLSFAVIPKCRTARATSCWANFNEAPDGGVPTYWVDARGHKRFVWMGDPTRTGGRGDDLQTGRWLTSAERANLSATVGHSPRWWRACFTDGVVVRCADGSVV